MSTVIEISVKEVSTDPRGIEKVQQGVRVLRLAQSDSVHLKPKDPKDVETEVIFANEIGKGKYTSASYYLTQGLVYEFSGVKEVPGSVYDDMKVNYSGSALKVSAK